MDSAAWQYRVVPALFGVPLWPWVYLAIWAPFALYSLLGLLGKR